MGKIIRNGRIDRDAIRDELYRVIEWPEESDKKYVTTTSTLIFAEIIAGLVVDDMREGGHEPTA